MNKNIVRLLSGLLLTAACSVLPAQEDESPAKKPAKPKALQEAQAKARAKRAEAKAKADAEAKAKAVDVNHATLEELKKLPGVTDAYAAGIIAKRPYKSKAELVSKDAIPNGLFQTIRKLVAAK
jgi:DNA uptake protein ComE-like DNA-binding protein